MWTEIEEYQNNYKKIPKSFICPERYLKTCLNKVKNTNQHRLKCGCDKKILADNESCPSALNWLK